MSNKTQLQTNNTALDSLVSRVNAAKDIAASLPEAGNSGGGNVDTCTVTINHPYTTTSYSLKDFIERYFITTYADENYSLESYDYNLDEPRITTTSITINNVVCGTQLSIYSHIESNIWGCSFDKAELVSNFAGRFIIKITANTGETATINIYDDD